MDATVERRLRLDRPSAGDTRGGVAATPNHASHHRSLGSAFCAARRDIETHAREPTDLDVLAAKKNESLLRKREPFFFVLVFAFW